MNRFSLGLSMGIVLSLIGCTNGENRAAIQELRQEIAQLKNTIEELKPGLGEIMGNIQRHHEKLYFAGQSENWDLANFEVGEIEEMLEQGTELHEHAHGSTVPLEDLRKLTDVSIREIETAIKAKKHPDFLAGFDNLTKSCNQCHLSTGYGFISIRSPQTTIFTSQIFKPW